MLRKLYENLGSFNLGLCLMAGVMALLAAGSFSRGGSESGHINDMALFSWLARTPAGESWWLWGALALLALLAINTVLCSIESLRSKYGSTRFLILIAPQIMHAGFLFIMLAHLCSAWGGEKQVIAVHEGGVIRLPDGSGIEISRVAQTSGAMGFPTDFSVHMRLLGGKEERAGTVSPNHPFFHRGEGFYLKEVALNPYPAALIEIHREPGAGLALAGALLFTVGNVALLAVRRGK